MHWNTRRHEEDNKGIKQLIYHFCELLGTRTHLSVRSESVFDKGAVSVKKDAKSPYRTLPDPSASSASISASSSSLEQPFRPNRRRMICPIVSGEDSRQAQAEDEAGGDTAGGLAEKDHWLLSLHLSYMPRVLVEVPGVSGVKNMFGVCCKGRRGK